MPTNYGRSHGFVWRCDSFRWQGRAIRALRLVVFAGMQLHCRHSQQMLALGLNGTPGPESMHLTLERKYGIINTVQVADWSNRVPAVVAYLPIGVPPVSAYARRHPPCRSYAMFDVQVAFCTLCEDMSLAFMSVLRSQRMSKKAALLPTPAT